MKKNYILIIITVLAAGIISCGRANKKTDDDTNRTINTDTVTRTDNSKRPTEENIPGKNLSTPTNGGRPTNNEILANIDQYLVSKSTFSPPPAAGGITNAGVTIQNMLPDITFQKAIIEVSILTADSAEFRTDYYVLQNIEPGEIETVKVPNASRGNSIVVHVVKLKSTELTNGEMVLVGNHFVPK
jgi:hypothetical protein